MRTHQRILLPLLLLSLACNALSQGPARTQPATSTRLSPTATSPLAASATPEPPTYIPPQCSTFPVATLPAATTLAPWPKREVLGFFTSELLRHYMTRVGQEPFEVEADPIQNSQEVPMVVLVSEDTMSYGEIFSGILQDIGRAQVVGQTTLGNVEQLRRFDLQDGSRLWLASARFVPLQAYADWEVQGIVPDVEIIAEWDTFTFETDPAIAAALELLGH